MNPPAWRFPIIYAAMVVTTATLHICSFPPGQVSIKDGTVSGGEFTHVTMVRFRKSLTTRLSAGAEPARLEQSMVDRERSVLVVNSLHLIDCLRQWEYQKRGIFEDPFPWDPTREG